jgi:hypothetical protein
MSMLFLVYDSGASKLLYRMVNDTLWILWIMGPVFYSKTRYITQNDNKSSYSLGIISILNCLEEDQFKSI